MNNKLNGLYDGMKWSLGTYKKDFYYYYSNSNDDRREISKIIVEIKTKVLYTMRFSDFLARLVLGTKKDKKKFGT